MTDRQTDRFNQKPSVNNNNWSYNAMSYIPRVVIRSCIWFGEDVDSKQNEASRQVTQYQFYGS